MAGILVGLRQFGRPRFGQLGFIGGPRVGDRVFDDFGVGAEALGLAQLGQGAVEVAREAGLGRDHAVEVTAAPISFVAVHRSPCAVCRE